jgi:hypothetical protein
VETKSAGCEKMKVSEVKLNPPWKEAFKVLSMMAYGTFVSHNEICAIMGLNYDTPEYRQQIATLREELKAIGKRLQSVHSEGYRILPPKEQVTTIVTKDLRGVMRKHRKVLTNIAAIPTQKLEDTDQRRVEQLTVSASRAFLTVATEYSNAANIIGIEARPQKMLAKAAEKKQE